MTTEPSDDVLIGLSDIAQVAGVTASAVSNWRRRHADFPTSRHSSGGADLFSLHDVEAWLIEQGKIDRPVPPSVALWAAADTLRVVWEPRQISSFLLAALVYMAACERARDSDATHRIAVPPGSDWAAVASEPPDRQLRRLLEAARQVEKANAVLDELILPGLDQRPKASQQLLAVVLHALDRARRDDGLGEAEAFHDLMNRHYSADRFDEAHGTPDDLADLMVRLSEPLGEVVLDPAVGRGGLLMLAGLHAPGQRQLRGVDIDPEAVRWARSWAFIYDLPAELRVLDALRTPPNELPPADSVLLDPPYGLANWGDAGLYMDTRWQFGPPPPKSADTAWLQLAANLLTAEGRAVVTLPTGSTFASGREQHIRQAMLDGGVIEAVIQLPPRLRRDTSIPLTVWVLRSPAAPPDRSAVLLVDASDLGTPAKTRHELESDDINRLGSLLGTWRRERRIAEQDQDIAAAVNIAELNDAVVTPKRYLTPKIHVDVEQLRADAARLHDELRAAVEGMQTALGGIGGVDGGDR